MISEWSIYEGKPKYGLTYNHTGNRVILHILGVVKLDKMEPRATVERVINGGKAKEYYLTGLVENRRSCLHGKTSADLIRQIWRIKIWW